MGMDGGTSEICMLARSDTALRRSRGSQNSRNMWVSRRFKGLVRYIRDTAKSCFTIPTPSPCPLTARTGSWHAPRLTAPDPPRDTRATDASLSHTCSRLIARSLPRASRRYAEVAWTSKNRTERSRSANQMSHEAHAGWHLASQAKAGAETDAVLDAAAALLDAEPRRARPSSRRAEEDKARPTASKSPSAVRRHCTRCCTCCRATANCAARHMV